MGNNYFKNKITLKDLEDLVREIIFKEEDDITYDEYIYNVNDNVIKVKTRRSKRNENNKNS